MPVLLPGDVGIVTYGVGALLLGAIVPLGWTVPGDVGIVARDGYGIGVGPEGDGSVFKAFWGSLDNVDLLIVRPLGFSGFGGIGLAHSVRVSVRQLSIFPSAFQIVLVHVRVSSHLPLLSAFHLPQFHFGAATTEVAETNVKINKVIALTLINVYFVMFFAPVWPLYVFRSLPKKIVIVYLQKKLILDHVAFGRPRA